LNHQIIFDAELLGRYDKSGPRYTSYPTAVQFNAGFTEADYRAPVPDEELDPALPAARHERPPVQAYRFVIGMRRSRPKARGVILIPTGPCRRLYSARSTMRITSAATSAGSPRASSSGTPRSCST